MPPEFRKVEALLALGKAQEAVAMVGRLPQAEQPTPEFLRLRGRALRAAGRIFDAELAFREALAMLPDDAAAMADLATTLMGQRRYKDALPLAQAAVTLKPEVAAWHCLAGVIADAMGELEAAEAALRQAELLAPNDAEPSVVLGFHLQRAGKHAAAEAAFTKAMGLDPRRPEPYRGLARLALQREDWVRARQLWLESLALDPTQKDAALQSILLLGHPSALPLRALVRFPIAGSALLAAGGFALLGWALKDGAPEWPGICVLLISIAGPMTRSILRGGSFA